MNRPLWLTTTSILLAACNGDSGTSASPSDGPDAAASEGGIARARCGDPGVLCYEIGPLEVPPGGEWQGFQALDVDNTEDLAIVGMEIEQIGATSHHFTVALWNGADAPLRGGPYDLFTAEGLTFVESTVGNALVGSVFRYVRIETGRYVGVTLPARSFLVNSAHYLNPSAAAATGHTKVIIRTVPKAEVRFATINALPGTNAIDVPVGATETVGGIWEPPTDAAVLLLTSHMHRHGRLFEAWKTVDGVETKIYSTTSYESPPLSILSGPPGDSPIVLRKAAGDHLRYECTHANDDLGVPLTYGPSAATNEMCILPVYYVNEPDALLALIAGGGDGNGFSWEVIPNGAE